jgi:hypothetical protein
MSCVQPNLELDCGSSTESKKHHVSRSFMALPRALVYWCTGVVPVHLLPVHCTVPDTVSYYSTMHPH